jgi:hypothetical protein
MGAVVAGRETPAATYIGDVRVARLSILREVKDMVAHTTSRIVRIIGVVTRAPRAEAEAVALAVAVQRLAERAAEAALLDLETAAGMIGGAATLCAMCSTIAGPVSGKVATAGRTKQETTRATTEAVTGRDATRGN